MKLTTFVVNAGALVALAAGVCGANAQELSDKSSSQQTLHFAGNGVHTLEVRAITGSITIEGYDGQDVEVLVDRTITAETADDRAAAAREVKLDTTDDSETLRLVVKSQDRPVCGEKHLHWDGWGRDYEVRYDFTIRVPKGTRLDLCTINHGDIAVSGMRADYAIHTINGRITMTDVAGSGEATTINGRVTASFVTAPHDASTFKTINGDVVLEMPDSFGADLRMKTFNGGLYTDFETQRLQTMNVSGERRDGMFVYRSNGFTTVRAGSGGPELTLETLNGDVRVLRRSN
jgi:hypothetical protein